MAQSLFFAVLVLFIVLAGGAYLFYKRRKRNRAIAEVLSGGDLLGRWTYSAAEWQQAVADEFSWAKPSDGGGEVFISPSAIYVRSASADQLIELSGGKAVTHASYRETEGAPLKIRVRWKVIESNADGTQERTKYYKEDYRIPVPFRERETAKRVAEWFSTRAEKNLAAYTDVVGGDEAISIFGDDSF
jgi:hypothetical protein